MLTLILFFISTTLANPLQVGVGVIDITPHDFEGRPVDPKDPFWSSGKPFYDTDGDGVFQFLHLAGFRPVYPMFMPNRFAGGIHDSIWSRALAIRGSNGEPLILVSTDLPGLTWKHINPVRRRIEHEFGISRSNIIIACTHNHAGPDAAGYWTTILKDHNKHYTDQLRQWMYESIVVALGDQKPARMKVVTTTHDSCFSPRTQELKREPNCNLPNSKSTYDDKHEALKYDLEVTQTDIRDPIVRNTRIVAAQFIALDGQTIATFINWHNHPDTLGGTNMAVSSDYPNYLREFVERELGGKAVYFTGTLGAQIGSAPGSLVPLWDENFERQYDKELRDIHGNRVPKFITENNWDKIRSIGYEIGNEVVTALRKETHNEQTVNVFVQTEPSDVPVDNFLHVFAGDSVFNFDIEDEDRMRHYGGRCANILGCVRSDVSVIQMGDLGIVTAPGEVDPAYFLGRNASTVGYGFFFGKTHYPAMVGFDQFMPGKHHAVLGQANNYLSYLIHRPDNHGWWNIFHPNYYEEGVTISRNFGDDTGNKIMQMLGASVRYSDREIFPKAPYLLNKFATTRRLATSKAVRRKRVAVAHDDNPPVADHPRSTTDVLDPFAIQVIGILDKPENR